MSSEPAARPGAPGGRMKSLFFSTLRRLFVELRLMHCYNARISCLNAIHDTSHCTE
jgi:hypothetical protein